MSYPSPVGALVADMDIPGLDRFPFMWWALGAKFEYPADARHLFCKCGSAAEAYFLRPFVQREGCAFTLDSTRHGIVEVIPQARVAKQYRVDFGIVTPHGAFAVEVDGLSFHHRRAEQIEADYLRARRVVAAGFTVVRFTAQEAFRDPAECWRQLDAIIAANEGRHSAERSR